METTATELAWAAGFFDGEGCTFTDKKGFIGMTISQNEPSTLNRFRAAVQFGRIHGPYAVGKHKHNRWEWRVSDLYEVQRVIETLWPYLSEPKKNQIRRHVYIVEVNSGTETS